MDQKTLETLSVFGKDVHRGLSQDDKHLSSRYFYDETGDKLFQQIMNMPEYYLTDCEYEIFTRQGAEILEALDFKSAFNLVELGAGDGYKTKVLLRYFMNHSELEYFPVDISANALKGLMASLREEFPSLRATPLNHEYFAALEELNQMRHSPKLILFLGSNIGNFTPALTREFLQKLYVAMAPGDQVLCGIDLKKDPEIILKAYNDPAGITRDFNLNILSRINRELGGNFEPDNFIHYPVYNPQSGECRSYLVSTVAQEVYLGATDQVYQFEAYEAIHTETSRKHSLTGIAAMAEECGFRVKENFIDSRNFFTDSLWVKD